MLQNPTVHIINPFSAISGGSEWEAASIYQAVNDATRTHLWYPSWHWEPPHPEFVRSLPLRRIEPKRLRVPWRGNVVQVGLYYNGLSRTMRWIKPRRVILLCNLLNREQLNSSIEQVEALGLGDRLEFVFCSDLVREWAGYEGFVSPSPIDLSRFSFGKRRTDDARSFTVGRLSRDTRDKFHEEDPALLEALAAEGMQVDILGGTCLAEEVNHPNVTLRAAGSVDAVSFLHGLDCFYYRLPEDAAEPFGRVVVEAMATGLPVVAHTSGGYAAYITHGTDGFLFETAEEAHRLIERLRHDRTLCLTIGKAARQRVETLYGPEATQAMIDFYTK